MLPQLLLGSLLVVATSAVHSGVTILVVRLLPLSAEPSLMQNMLGRVTLVAGMVLLLFLAALVEVTIWAATYLRVGAIEGVEVALYFSMVTFTTLGYGDMVLDDQWRLLASFQAAIGIIMFGWTTAIIVMIVQRMIQAAERQASTAA